MRIVVQIDSIVVEFMSKVLYATVVYFIELLEDIMEAINSGKGVNFFLK